MPTAHDEPAHSAGFLSRRLRRGRGHRLEHRERTTVRDVACSRCARSWKMLLAAASTCLRVRRRTARAASGWRRPSREVLAPHIEGPANAFRRRHRIHGPFVLYGGRIDPGKGCEEMLEYFQTYLTEGGDVTLALMGTKLMPLPEDPHVRFAGMLPDEERLHALEAASVVIVPSPHESLSLLALEAFAVGTPVLANARSEVLVDHCRQSHAGLYLRGPVGVHRGVEAAAPRSRRSAPRWARTARPTSTATTGGARSCRSTSACLRGCGRTPGSRSGRPNASGRGTSRASAAASRVASAGGSSGRERGRPADRGGGDRRASRSRDQRPGASAPTLTAAAQRRLLLALRLRRPVPSSAARRPALCGSSSYRLIISLRVVGLDVQEFGGLLLNAAGRLERRLDVPPLVPDDHFAEMDAARRESRRRARPPAGSALT